MRLVVVVVVVVPSSFVLFFLLLASKHHWAIQTEPSSGNEAQHSAMEGDEEEKAVFRVFRIFVKSWDDVGAVSALRTIAQENPEIDFWLDSVHPGRFADVMVSPSGMPLFQHFLQAHPSLEVQITVEDVEKLILRNEFRPMIERRKEANRRRRMSRRRRQNGANNLEAYRLSRRRDHQKEGKTAPSSTLFDQLRGAHYPFGEYTGYSTMIRYLRTLEFYYPHLVQLIQIGTTHEGRSIEGVKIGPNPEMLPSGHGRMARQKAKRAFWIDGNMHAREWASGHTALFIINQLVANYGRDPFLTNALNRVDFYIIPCANPDGFEFSRSSMNPKIRLWRKNRSPEQCTRTWSGLLCCRGVDLNRNFDFHWAETGSSLNACSNLFAGKRAFSEPEARAIANFLQSDEMRGRVDAFITLHTYAQMWIHPYSHEYQFYPNDVQKLKSLALRATSRLKEIYGTSYRVGTGADLLAPASGGSDDWAKEGLGIKFVYLVELRPQLDLSNGFILRQEELLPTAVETFEAIKEVIKGVLLENGLPAGLPLALNSTNGQSNNNTQFGGITSSLPSSTQMMTSSSPSSLRTSSTFSTTTLSDWRPSFPGQPIMTSTTLTNPFHSTAPNIFFPSSSSPFPSLLSSPSSSSFSPPPSSPASTTTTGADDLIFVPTKLEEKMREGGRGQEEGMMTKKPARIFFTLPWVPTRRVNPAKRVQQTTRSGVGRVSVLIPATTTPSSFPPSSSPLSSTTLLFTAVQPEDETHEIVLPTTLTPLSRNAPRWVGSNPLGQFVTHKRDKNGKWTELKNVENLLALPEGEEVGTPSRSTTTTIFPHQATRRCSDEKSSCAFWIRAHPPVCVEQRRFMQRNCAFSCGFCKSN